MARPERKNADYFPFYAKDGRTLFLLESKYKCKGTGFFTNVMRFLTLETDHHVSIQDETDAMYFFSKCHCDPESGMDMLDIMSKTGKINKQLWGESIIVSQDLLDSLADAYRNRKNIIISIDKIKQKYISYKENKVSDAGNPQEPVVSDVEKPQRKGKETKGKETKVKEPTKTGSASFHFSIKNNGFLKDIEFEAKLISKLKINPKFGKKINIYHIIQEVTNKNIHPQAIYESLRALRGGWDGIKTGYQGYFRTILFKYNAKYNERDRARECQAFKDELSNMPDSLLNLTKGIG